MRINIIKFVYMHGYFYSAITDVGRSKLKEAILDPEPEVSRKCTVC